MEPVTGQAVDGRLFPRLGGCAAVPGVIRGNFSDTGTPWVAGYYAHGYQMPASPGAQPVETPQFAPSPAWTAGAIISTTDDLHRFYAAPLGGRLLRPSLLKHRLPRPQWAPGRRPHAAHRA
ncbi:serine hydrolase [Actinoplanes sp. NBRC 103695]|uniref:serine hydrolase n=1 Tax=Actinoplanes sp. NBRC 103695 TaxID=3032202 RepID=UPI0024A0230A|nr:serine hydrolase [Actinoplanes sp. NBRC 103695]GLY99557.1 hypothetical protein Acsp02_68100 [Actinoplanes sp. NBRC 103695]